jgi:hypothetical protein
LFMYDYPDFFMCDYPDLFMYDYPEWGFSVLFPQL